jgi:hypothetical protein
MDVHPHIFPPTVFFIPSREEDFDAAKSRFSDVTAENEFKEKLGNDRKERGEVARPFVCVVGQCVSAFKARKALVQHVRDVHGDGENLNQNDIVIMSLDMSLTYYLDFLP